LDERQSSHWNTSGTGHVIAVFRSDSRSIHHERTVFHHFARNRSERQGLRLPLRVLCVAALDSRRLVFRFGGHCGGVATTKHTPSSHPKRNTEREQKPQH